MFENPRRGRQARNFTTNFPKILDLKSSSEQTFPENWRWVPLLNVPVTVPPPPPRGGSRACKATRQTHCVIIPRWWLDQLTNHSNRQTITHPKYQSEVEYKNETFGGLPLNESQSVKNKVSIFDNNKYWDLRDSFWRLKLYHPTFLCPKLLCLVI